MSQIEIITIGDELVEGRLVDTNAGWLSDRLTIEGFSVGRHTSVRDDRTAIVSCLRESASRSEAVIVSGGLGPTTDDLTAECAAEAAEVTVVRFQEALQHVQMFFAARGRKMSPNNEKQADLPKGSTILPNPGGTAVGFQVHIDKCECSFLPGVPRELKNIFEVSVLPRLQNTLISKSPLVRTLKVFGKGESDVGHLLDRLGAELPSTADFTVQYRATFPEIHIRLVLSGLEEETGIATINHLTSQAAKRLGKHVFATGDGKLHPDFIQTVATDLNCAEASVAIADCCTGGLVASLLTATETGGKALLGTFLAPTTAEASELLGEDTSLDLEGLATAIRNRTDATFGLAVAGSTEGDDIDPPGTIRVALSDHSQTLVKTYNFPIDAPRFKRLAAYVSLGLVRREL